MKKRIFALLQAFVLLTAVTACGTSDTAASNDPVAEAGYKIATGDSAGSYYAFGNVLAAHMSDATGVDIEVVSTDGSVENIKGVSEGTYQLGMAQSDMMSYAWNGIVPFAKGGETKSIRAIGGLYEEAVQIITLDESIQTVSDLRGKTVSVGESDSGVIINAMNVLDVYGLRTDEDIQTVAMSFSDSMEAMKDGKIDAAFIVAGTPTNAVEELIAAEQVHLVSIEDDYVALLTKWFPYYNKHVILSGTYTGVNYDVTTVSVRAAMIVSADMPEEEVYNLTAGIYDNVENVAVILARGIDMSVENGVTGINIPFHKGAAKYFAEKGVYAPTE